MRFCRPLEPPEIEIANVCFSQSLLTTANQMNAHAEIRHVELGRGVSEECGVHFGGQDEEHVRYTRKTV